jgi:hypothetical protein
MARQVHGGRPEPLPLFDLKTLRTRLRKLTDNEHRQFWASSFNIVGPEWMIILTLAEAERFSASVATISTALSVDQAFVRAHARQLKKQAHIRSTRRGVVVEWSLTASAVAKLAAWLSSRSS